MSTRVARSAFERDGLRGCGRDERPDVLRRSADGPGLARGRPAAGIRRPAAGNGRRGRGDDNSRTARVLGTVERRGGAGPDRPVAQAKQTIGLIRWLLWAVAAGIVGAILYLSTLERVRDFAVFKAIGISTGSLARGLLGQAVVLSLAAAGIAILLELALAPLSAMRVEVRQGLRSSSSPSRSAPARSQASPPSGEQ